ncbi:MAG: hypothetical protein LBQ68_08020 [Clostridiales bacterium]|nr:hypothetical protein [Clostridiales bacterium]
MPNIQEYIIDIALTILTSLLLGYIIHMKSQVKQTKKEYGAVKNGLKELLRAQIIRMYETAHEHNYCPIYILETINSLYEQYKELGGNGTIAELIKRMHDLPARQSGKESKLDGLQRKE